MAATTPPAGAAPLRILVISNCPLDPLQGSGYVITGYAQRMRERGHHVTAFGIEHFTPLQGMRRLTRIRRLLGYAATAWRHARSDTYDVVELWGAEGWLALVLLRLLGRHTPVAVSRSNGLETHWRHLAGEHSAWPVSALRRGIASLPEIAFRGGAALTVVSRFDARFAQQRSYQPPERLLVMENPLQPAWLGQAPRFEREPVIGYVGAWLPNKGSELLPQAMRLVLAKAPQARFLLIGIGGAAQAQIAAQFPGETRIETLAFCPRDEMVRHYHRMAVLMVPSFFESFGLVSAEAMSCGVALAATRAGLAADLAPGECAPIEERSADGIAQAVLALLADEPRRQSIARAGHARVQSLDWASATDRLEALYHALVRSPLARAQPHQPPQAKHTA